MHGAHPSSLDKTLMNGGFSFLQIALFGVAVDKISTKDVDQSSVEIGKEGFSVKAEDENGAKPLATKVWKRRKM